MGVVRHDRHGVAGRHDGYNRPETATIPSCELRAAAAAARRDRRRRDVEERDRSTTSPNTHSVARPRPSLIAGYTGNPSGALGDTIRWHCRHLAFTGTWWAVDNASH